MIEPIAWLDRQFTFDLPLGVFPSVLERLRGTPARAAELIHGLAEETLSKRAKGRWSVKEHLGHLIELQPLDERRLREFLRRAKVLSPADPDNRATEDANYRDVAIGDILTRLRVGRHELVGRLEILSEQQVAITALHPRLQKPMRLLDWAYFISEHDDHHLAHAAKAIRDLNRKFESRD